MSLFSHSLSPDQLPLLCTPFSFATYHVIYSACATTSTPTIAFVLISPVHTDKGGQTEYTPPYTSHLVPSPHAHAHTSPPHSHFAPCSYLTPHSCLHLHLTSPFTLLPACTSSYFIRLYSALFHSFSPIITDTPIPLHTPAYLLVFALASCLHSLALCAHT